MTDMKVFSSPYFNALRAVIVDGEPWFVAADVCKALGLAPNATRRLEDDERNTLRLTSGIPGNPNMAVVNESGLYSLILGCRKPEAKVFRRWVTGEVLPSIRKHGAYIHHDTLEEMLASPDFGIRLLLELKRERTERAALEAHTRRQVAEIRELAPKAGYCDLILQNDALIPITVIAKDYGMVARDMNMLLHELGVQYRIGNEWVLYHRHAGQGYAHSTTEIVNGGKAIMYTCWTQKGRRFIYDLLKAERGLVPVIERLEVGCVAAAGGAEARYE